jgi:hypothetical protein
LDFSPAKERWPLKWALALEFPTIKTALLNAKAIQEVSR